eukprot:TRINITY_DN15523_c0_g3_i1.p1 TRINITY_DN15523_c0_g3~~TRINITY_DN15523_c0_g3_i1.p1  ORF type:complete len:112 (-),score=8.76 TRINITY_DN15523_c0_g3_i1:102-437(-)
MVSSLVFLLLLFSSSSPSSFSIYTAPFLTQPATFVVSLSNGLPSPFHSQNSTLGFHFHQKQLSFYPKDIIFFPVLETPCHKLPFPSKITSHSHSYTLFLPISRTQISSSSP